MTITLTLGTSGPLKRDIIELAFGELAMAGYEFGRTPDEIRDALLRLNAMMREWPFSTLGYQQPDYGNGSAEDVSGVDPQWLNVIASKLALRIAPAFGASMSPDAKANLATAMSLLQAGAATIPTMPLARNTPRGAGNRGGFGTFINETADDV